MMSNAESARPAIVLVVEDEPLQRLALVSAFEDGGLEVFEASDADAAVRLLESRTDIRVVVTDIQMPGAMDGLKLAAAVRHRWPPIEIIVLSAGVAPKSDELPERAEFMAKPIVTDRLLERVFHLAA